jgi:hypothetical protein
MFALMGCWGERILLLFLLWAVLPDMITHLDAVFIMPCTCCIMFDNGGGDDFAVGSPCQWVDLNGDTLVDLVYTLQYWNDDNLNNYQTNAAQYVFLNNGTSFCQASASSVNTIFCPFPVPPC